MTGWLGTSRLAMELLVLLLLLWLRRKGRTGVILSYVLSVNLLLYHAFLGVDILFSIGQELRRFLENFLERKK